MSRGTLAAVVALGFAGMGLGGWVYAVGRSGGLLIGVLVLTVIAAGVIADAGSERGRK